MMASNAEVPVISTRELTRDFAIGFLRRRTLRALDGVSVDIRPGCVTGLLGPNGSGKTTFMKILLGLLRPTSGSATVFGSVAGAFDALARTGYMPEQPGFLPHLTGEECLHLAGRLHGLPRAERRKNVTAALDVFDLQPARDRPVGQYSQGMKKRVALAQALLNDPDLLVLDEPTAGLDPASAAFVHDKVRELANRGKTVVLSSHLLGRVERVADRLVIIDRGKVLVEGVLHDIAGAVDAVELVVAATDPAGPCQALEAAGFTVTASRRAADPLETVFLKLTGERGTSGDRT